MARFVKQLLEKIDIFHNSLLLHNGLLKTCGAPKCHIRSISSMWQNEGIERSLQVNNLAKR